MTNGVPRLPSPSVLESTAYWSSGINPLMDLKENNSSLRIAAIVGDRLFQGLRFEGELMLLCPENWQRIIKYGKLDILLIESAWFTATGHWYMAQSGYTHESDELKKIIAYAKKQGVPTVFWHTWDCAYHEYFSDFAELFDHVFCADPAQTARFQKSGIDAIDLSPAIQPAIHNPIRRFGRHNALQIDILYDGWTDVLLLGDKLAVLENLLPYGLKVIDSSHTLATSQMSKSPEVLVDSILGSATATEMQTILKYSKAYLSFSETNKSVTLQSWEALEAAACRTAIIHRGSLSKEDLRNKFALQCGSDKELVLEFARMQEDPLYCERMAHRAWRFAFQNNTYSNRIQTICSIVGLDHDWVEYPKASLVTPTIRPHLIADCIEQYDKQTYANKECIVVLNGTEEQAKELGDTSDTRPDIKMNVVPREYFAGTCLNVGGLLSSGQIVFRIDDDDHYGDNYVLDSMLYLRAIDADIFGKTFSFMQIEGKGVYERRKKPLPPLLFRCKHLGRETVPIAGCSIALRKDFFVKHKYSDRNALSADTELCARLKDEAPNSVGLILDRMNLVVERKKNQEDHTWKYDLDTLIDNSDYLFKNIDSLMV